MTSPPPLLPYQQGHLDGLCGLYAVVNGVRWALADRADDFTAEDWQALFLTLLIATEDTIGAVTAAGCGIDPKPLARILKSAIRHMADEHHVEVTVSRVFKRKERPPFSEVLPRLAELAARPRSAILVSLSGHLDHWTVLRKVTPSALSLLDSSGFARVASANCRMPHESSLVATREHVIHPKAVFLIEAGRN